jgi:hypothetical protein
MALLYSAEKQKSFYRGDAEKNILFLIAPQALSNDVSLRLCASAVKFLFGFPLHATVNQ